MSVLDSGRILHTESLPVALADSLSRGAIPDSTSAKSDYQVQVEVAKMKKSNQASIALLCFRTQCSSVVLMS